jgi:hypothetical protein
MTEEIKKLIESVPVLNLGMYRIDSEHKSHFKAVRKSDFDRVVEELTKWNKVEDKLPDEHMPVLCKSKTIVGGTYIYFVGYYEPIAGYFYDAYRLYRLVTEWKPII